MLQKCSICKKINPDLQDIDLPKYNAYFHNIVKQIKKNYRITELSEMSWSKNLLICLKHFYTSQEYKAILDKYKNIDDEKKKEIKKRYTNHVKTNCKELNSLELSVIHNIQIKTYQKEVESIKKCANLNIKKI